MSRAEIDPRGHRGKASNGVYLQQYWRTNLRRIVHSHQPRRCGGAPRRIPSTEIHRFLDACDTESPALTCCIPRSIIAAGVDISSSNEAINVSNSTNLKQTLTIIVFHCISAEYSSCKLFGVSNHNYQLRKICTQCHRLSICSICSLR